MKLLVIEALDAVSEGYSPDRVVVDPRLNASFIAECRTRGLDAPASSLNHFLLNLRKSGSLSGRRKSKRTSFPNEEGYRFASEMAVRFVERRDGVSLDEVMCEPARAAEFDTIAATIVPGYTPLEYRWAALNLRKAKKLKPEIVARVVIPITVLSVRVDVLNPNELPAAQGLYMFFTSKELLYVGETEDLRQRLRKHLDHSDNKGLARWLWKEGPEALHLEVQVLASDVSTRIRRACELELIRSRNPVFNVRR